MRTWFFFFSLLAMVAESGSALGAERGFMFAPVAEARPANAPEVFVVVTEEQRFSFMAPRGWNVSHHAEERLVTLKQGENTLTLRFGTGKETGEARETEEGWLKELQGRYEGAEVLDRPSLKALSKWAISFDLEWKHAGEFARMGRFARVGLKTGGVDFGLICPPDEFGTHLATMMQLMVTMRAAGVDERVEIPRFLEE